MNQVKKCCQRLSLPLRETVIHRETCADTSSETTHVRYMHATTNNTVWTRIRRNSAGDTLGGATQSRLATTYQRSSPWQHIQTRGVNWSQNKAAAVAAKHAVEPDQHQPPASNQVSNNGYAQDLRRFLEEIGGTSPREARYWLKHFQHKTDPYHPFAIVQVDQRVFEHPDLLDKLGSGLSFLHRNNMKCVVVHGHQVPDKLAVTPEQLQGSRLQIASDSMMLVSILESHGAHARPLFSGSHILHAEQVTCFKGHLKGINTDPIKWAMSSGHIPILTSIGESQSGQLLTLDLWQVTSNLSTLMQPLKVMCLNTKGGMTDEKGEIIPNINIEDNLDIVFDKPWCTKDKTEQISAISQLLHKLPNQSAVVITSANQLLSELFTHHGSGTFIRVTERINKYPSFEDIDVPRLITLLNKSFGKDLRDTYFDGLNGRLDRIFLSNSYNAAAVITKEKNIDVPYLDKFAVSLAKQGEGISDMLWDCVTKEFKSLFWRSRAENKVNPWYFKKCDGSWSNGEWIVFWYGIENHRESISLVEQALSLPSSFGNIVTGKDNTYVE